MKKFAFLFTLLLGSMMVFAQKPNKAELKQLQAFMAQTSEKGVTNAQALNISDLSNPSTWEGVKMDNGRVTSIDWKGKKLAGQLNLAGFNFLQKVDVSRNAITSLSVAGDAALTELNASRNKLTTADLAG